MAVCCLNSASMFVQVALGFRNESICVERGGAPKAPVFGGTNPASVPSHVRNQVSQPFIVPTFALSEMLKHRLVGKSLALSLSAEFVPSANCGPSNTVGMAHLLES